MLDYNILDEMIDTTVPIEDKLRYLGLTKETALTKAEAYIADFRNIAEKLGISGSHKLFFFKAMCSKVDLMDNEQLRFFCSVVGDSGLLFGDSEGDHRISLWLSDSTKSDYLYKLITDRRVANERIKQISACAQATTAGKSHHSSEVYDLLAENNYALDCPDITVLRDNLDDVEWLINNYTDFDLIAPFVYFQVLTRNGKKMLEKQGYSLTVENLFNYHDFIIEKDNGKNYDTYTDHCQLYADLIDIFPEAAKQLCHACFLASSNLSQWAFDNLEPCENIPMYLDNVISLSLFSCFDEGLNEFTFFEENPVDLDDVMQYMLSNKRIVASVSKFVDELDEATLNGFVTDPEPIVNGMMSWLKYDDKDSTIVKALCYMKLLQRIDEDCYKQICALISDRPKGGAA